MDTGETGFATVDKDFARLHSLPLQELKTPGQIEVIDGILIDSEVVTHIARLALHIRSHEEDAPFFVTSLRPHPLVVGIH